MELFCFVLQKGKSAVCPTGLNSIAAQKKPLVSQPGC